MLSALPSRSVPAASKPKAICHSGIDSRSVPPAEKTQDEHLSSLSCKLVPPPGTASWFLHLGQIEDRISENDDLGRRSVQVQMSTATSPLGYASLWVLKKLLRFILMRNAEPVPLLQLLHSCDAPSSPIIKSSNISSVVHASAAPSTSRYTGSRGPIPEGFRQSGFIGELGYFSCERHFGVTGWWAG